MAFNFQLPKISIYFSSFKIHMHFCYSVTLQIKDYKNTENTFLKNKILKIIFLTKIMIIVAVEPLILKIYSPKLFSRTQLVFKCR